MWMESVADRVAGGGCPYCSGEKKEEQAQIKLRERIDKEKYSYRGSSY